LLFADESLLDSFSQSRQPRLETKNELKKLLGISGVLMTLALPFGVVPRVLQAQELNHASQKAEQQLPAVSTEQVALAPAQRKMRLPGAIEAIFDTPVYARTTGYVSQRFADIGDRVSAGQLLAHIDTPDIDSSAAEAQAQVLTRIANKAQSEANRDRAQADLDRATAELSQARANLVALESDQQFANSTFQRFKKLGEEGAVSKQDVDEKETRYKMTSATKQAAEDRIRAASSDVIAARARLKAEGANINASDADISAARAHANRSSTEKDFQNILSPFSGVVTERNVDNGVLVSAGSETTKSVLYRIARIDTVKVFVDVPQFAATGIRVGQPVSIALKEFPDRVFTGKVARTSVALDPTARTLRTEVHIANRDLALAPGMYADVEFSVPRSSKVFLIPSNSLVNRGAGPQVVTLSAEKKAHYSPVTLGEDLGDKLEVVAGLTGKELLVVNPSDSITEGARLSAN
jgi:RND family efflux transporter, MFP subunit